MKHLFAALLLMASLPTMAQTYSNPVYNHDFPDPSIQRSQDGTWYCYATNYQCVKSNDLVNWTKVNDVFYRPTWNDSTYVKDGETKHDYYSIWASDVNYFGGKYVMYYASALWGNGSRTGIGVATGTSASKFSDVGRMFRSTEIKVENSIDPCYIEEWDKKYLAWGSFNGIYITELTDDGLAVKDFKNIKKIAGTAFEGTMIHKHNGKYYLFASIGACCEGLNSTYQTVVGRSTNLTGPYLTKTGETMTNNGRTIIITKNNRFKGPGHNSEIITDDAGQDWILYHSYDANDESKGRVLMMDRLLWDKSGWPYVEGGSPSTTEVDAPVFYKGDGSDMTYRLSNQDFMKSGFSEWTSQSDGCSVFASGQDVQGASIFCPLMHVQGGSFSIRQDRTNLPDGYYEVRLQQMSTQGGASVRVGAVVTPVQDLREVEGTHPTTGLTISKAFLAGSYPQSAYGLVVNGKLTVGLLGTLADDEDFWAGNIQLIRRDKNDEAAQAIAPWYIQRVAEVCASPAVDDYYKNKLQGYVTSLQSSTSTTGTYNALVNIHKQLDRLGALEPDYDAIQSVTLDATSTTPYDLQGRVANDSTRGVIIQDGKKRLQ